MNISELALDPRVLDDGVWLSPRPSSPEIRVKARAKSPDYFKRVAADRARLEREWPKGDVPDDKSRAANAAALFEFCVADFEGLTDRGGVPLTRERAIGYCGEFRYYPLFQVFEDAANLATARTESDAERAEGNSPASCASSLSGDASPTS